MPQLGPRTEERDTFNREKTDLLQKAITSQGHDATVTPVSVPVDAAGDGSGRARGDGPQNHFQLAEWIAGIFGKEIVWVTSEGSFGINGVVLPGGELSKYVFINVNALHGRAGGELLHYPWASSPCASPP